jgi:hypothetical protein
VEEVLDNNNRAFKEWAFVCEALKSGRQTVLIRKGGIREEEGEFRISDSEFFLMPTYEHQTADLLQPQVVPQFQGLQAQPIDFNSVTIDSYVVVDTIAICDDEQRLRLLAREHVWNEKYIQMRLDFNPYDPLYVLLLRVYRLVEPVSLPMRPEYAGCKSWVTLDRSISIDGARPAVADEEFELRKANVLDIL